MTTVVCNSIPAKSCSGNFRLLISQGATASVNVPAKTASPTFRILGGYLSAVNPWNQFYTPQPTYVMQGWDIGSGAFVFWTSVGSPNLSPTSTTPALVGGIAAGSVSVLGQI